MGWRAQVKVSADSAWTNNGVVFETDREAERYAHDLQRRWLAVVYVRIAPTSDPVTHRYEHGVLIPLDSS